MHFILEFYSVFFKNIKRKILWYVLVYLLLHKYCDMYVLIKNSK